MVASVLVPRRANYPYYCITYSRPGIFTIVFNGIKKTKKNMKLYESLTQMKRFGIILLKNPKILCDLGKNKRFLPNF